MLEKLRTYIGTQASNPVAYARQELVTSLLGWVPSLPGIAARGLAYRLILAADGTPAIEQSVRIRFAENVRLGRNVFLDHGVYLHACPGGISIGDDSLVMHGSILHVYNFRGLPNAGITIGRRVIVGEMSVIRGQGGVTIGDDVLIAPQVQILAVDHVVQSARAPIMTQGLITEGIVIEDGAWLGAGAIVTDGVRIGRNAVVGAGAVVTRDIPAGTVAVGVPARVVREIDDCDPPVDLAPPVLHQLRNERMELAAATGVRRTG
ncbi:MAG: transferase [Chloroflexi bacterium]|nr:MAG: transferase [Chloroflexota bacterium]